MKKINFLNKFSDLRKSISTRSIYSENKTYKDLVVAFITGKSLSTSVSGRSYYIVGDSEKRFPVHEVVPIAYLQRFGNNIDIQLNANLSESLTGIAKVFSHIQSFYTSGNYLVQDQDDINDFFGTVDVAYDIDVSPVSFSSIFNEFISSSSFNNFERFKENFLKIKDIPKYQKLYERYKDRVLTTGNSEEYELVDIKRSHVIYSGKSDIEFTKYRDKFKEQISKLVSGEVPANIADKVVSEIKRLPELTILPSEKALLGELQGEIFKAVADYINRYGITSYYDYINNLAKSGIITQGEFPAKTLFDSENNTLKSDSKSQVLKSILIKLSKAFNELNSSQNLELLQMAQSSGMMNFFTYLDTYDIKEIIDSLSSKNKKQQGLLKDKDGKLSKYIGQVYKFQNAFFTKIRNIALSSLGNKEGIELLMSKNTSKYLEDFNKELVSSVREVFDDPEINESLDKTAQIYNDLLSKILKTGGEVGGKDINPAESAQKFRTLAKSFIVSVLSNNINNLYKKNVTGTPLQNLIPDILRMHSFTESLSSNDFKSNLENGYLWSGSTFGETELTYSVNGGVVDLPIGFITYKALATKSKHVGEGHILRIEIKDNLIRISLPSFYIGVSKVSDATVMKRIMEMSVQYNRMGNFLNNEIVGTLTNKEIQQESLEDNKELAQLIKSGKTIMYLSKDGDLVNFSSYDSKDYFEIQNLTARGLKVTDLENFYSKLEDRELQRKFKRFFLKDDIANAISGYRLWINKTVSDAKKEWDSVDPNDPNFYDKKFNSITAFKTKEEWVIENTRMVMEMKIGDTGAFSVHSIYSLWNTYTEKVKNPDGTPGEVTKVKKIFTPYFRRYTPNPAYVYAFQNIGLSNAAKDKIDAVRNYSGQFKKVAKSMSEFNRKNGISYTYEESGKGAEYFPTIFEGDIVSGYTKVIDFIKTNYFQEASVDTLGAGVWVTIDPKVINNEGEEVYRRLVEAQAKIKQQYHSNIVRIVELLQKIHSLNLELSKILLDFSAKDKDMSEHRKRLFTSIKKEVFDQFKIELRESVQTALRDGILTVESVVSEPGAFHGSESLPAESFNPDQALNKFSDSFISTLKNIVTKVTNEETAVNKFKPKEDPEFPDFYKRNMDKFMVLNNEIRKYSLELLTLASNYKLKKSTMMDLIKSGRVQNYLQYEQEKFRDNELKEDRGEEENQ